MTKEELEKKNAELKTKVTALENVANNLLESWCRNKEDYCPHLAKLEKENAELKDKLNNLSSVAEVRLANWQKYEKENAELKKLIEDMYYQIPASYSDYFKDVMERARQFLKE